MIQAASATTSRTIPREYANRIDSATMAITTRSRAVIGSGTARADDRRPRAAAPLSRGYDEAVPPIGLELRARGVRVGARREPADAHAPQRAAARLDGLRVGGGVARLLQLRCERVRALVVGERRDLHGEALAARRRCGCWGGRWGRC